jgi:transposase
MIYAQVNEEKLKPLRKELKSTKDAGWYRRLKIIQLSSQGKKVPQLAKQFDVCQATVRDYIKRCNSGGLETLRRGSSSGRPPKTHLTRAGWEELLHHSPCQFEKLNTGARNWTYKMLSVYCHEYLGVQMGQSGIGMLMKRMDIRWNRGKLKVTSPDPQYTVKRERVETLKKSPGRNAE